MKKLILFLFIALTALSATSSFAQTQIFQGVQTKFPYTFSMPGSYKLTSNINASSATVSALIFTSSNVTLDLNGYSINGLLVCTASSCSNSNPTVGVNMQGAASTVKNGSITGFYNAVIANQPSSMVQNLNITSCYIAIEAEGGSVDHNAIAKCAGPGIVLYYGTASYNTIMSVGGYGIGVNYGTVVNNSVSLSADSGINAYETSVLNNTVTSSAYGISMMGGYYGGNTLIGNTTDVYIYGGNPVTTKNNACTSGPC